MKRLIKLAIWAFACSVGLAQAGELTLSTTGYTGSFLTDFPVLVRLSEAKMTGFKYADAAPENVRFLSPDGETEYPREIERWNPEGESLIWVKLPFLSSRTSFKFAWGGEPATTASSDVWARPDNSYIGVWHMAEASGDVADATGHGLTAEPYANATTKGYDKSVAGEGPVGNSRRISEEYTQTGPRLRVANGPNLVHGSRFTVSCWAKEVEDTARRQQYARLLSRKTGHRNPGWEIQDDTAGNNGTFQQYAGAGDVKATASVANKLDWHHYVFVYDDTRLSAYVDGFPSGTATVAPENVATDQNLALSIGAGGDAEWSLNGWMDEVRLLQGAANSVWIKACYDTQSDPDFVTVGAPPPLPEGTIVFDDPAQPTKTLTAATAAPGVVSAIPEATIEVSQSSGHPANHGLALLSPNGTDAAEIDLSAGGTLTIDADLTDLEFDTSEACVSGDWADGVSAETLLPASPTTTTEGEAITYWKDRSLSAIKAFRATVVDGDGTQAFVARSLYFANDNATASVQFSFRRNVTWLFTAKVEFRQAGADITARVCWIRGVQNAPDEAISGENYAGNKSTPQTVYDGQTSLAGIGIRAIEAGELGMKGGKGIAVRAGIGEMGNDSIPYGAAKKVLLWKNLSLDELEGVQADVTRIGTYRCLGRLLESTATTKTFVFQHYYDNYIAGAKVVFEQDGPYVYAYVSSGGSTSASYSTTNPVEIYPDRTIPYDGGYSGSNANISKVVPLTKGRLAVNGQIQLAGSLDLGLSTVNIGSAALTEMSMPVTGFGGLCFSREAGRQGFRATQAAVNDFQGIAKFDGCRADFDSSFKLGDGVCLILANGATVAAGYHSLWNDMTPKKDYNLGYQVSSGSTFSCAGSSFRRDGTLHASYTLVDGATLDWEAEQSYYLGHLCLRNGSKLTGKSFRFGSMNPKVIVSEDESSKTNVISAEMRLYQGSLNDAMGYVCRSGTLKITANVNRFKDGNSYSLRILKLGLGTLLYDCKNTSTTQHEVVEGTFRLAKNEAYNDESLLFLRSGARVELAPNVSTAARRLIVTNSTAEATSTQTLALESGAALTLPEDGLEFQNGGTLQIEGEFDPKAVRIGTTKCLTDEQLASIRWMKDGRARRLVQSDDGYLCQPGLVLIVR